MVRLAQRLCSTSLLLLLISPLAAGCGDNSTSTRDANAPDTVTVPDTGAKLDLAGDTVVVPPDTKPALPDAGADQIPLPPDTAPPKPDVGGDTAPPKPDVGADTPAPNRDANPVATGDAPTDSAGDVAGDAGSAAEAGSADAGATD